jgi:U3 small nucleolar RNA-associated protein 12
MFILIILTVSIKTLNSAKDMLVKFWDLDTRHCFKTLVNHRSEVNDLMLANGGSRLLTGCHDNELRVYELTYKDDLKEATTTEPVDEANKKRMKKKKSVTSMNEEEENNTTEENNENGTADEDTEAQSLLSSMVECRLIGSVVRESKDPLGQLCLDNTGLIFGSHSSNEKHVEIYKINTDEEITRRLAKRLKKQKRKLVANGEDSAAAQQQNGDDDNDSERPT